MKEMGNLLQNDCNLKGVSPLMLPLPYPALRAREENQYYASLLTVDYCGSVSELTAILQYIHGEGHLCGGQCAQAGTILGIAMAEMIHLQKLGELILLLGGNTEYAVHSRCGTQMWTPGYLDYAEELEDIIAVNVKAEKDAIAQYRKHMDLIEDDYVNAVIARIIQDEEYHIMLLQML